MRKAECLDSNFSLTLVNHTTFLYQSAIATAMLHNKLPRTSWLNTVFTPMLVNQHVNAMELVSPGLVQAVGHLGLALGFG